MKLKTRLRSAGVTRASIWEQSFQRNGWAVSTNHKGIRKCLNFIAQNASAAIQVKDMVRISELSRRGFCKAFKHNVGVNPGTFLRRLRIENAKRLLLQYDLKLREIAPMCGFRNVNTFSVAFLREVGLSPKKFQRQNWLAGCQAGQRAKKFASPFKISLFPKNGREGPGPRFGGGKKPSKTWHLSRRTDIYEKASA